MIRGKFGITKKKYNSVTKTIDGHKFNSVAEAECYLMLKLLERNGQIKIIELQPKVYMTNARILFILDFLIEQNGEKIYIEFKGFETPVYKIKKRLWRHYGKGLLRILKKRGFEFDTVEEVRADQGV